MKRAYVIVVLLLVFPAVAMANPSKPGGYFSGFLGFNNTKNATMETTDYTTLPAQTYQDRLEFDPGIYIGGTGGYDFGTVRMEGELSFRNAEIQRVNGEHPGDRNLGMLAMMFNCFLDLETYSPVTPYLGGGVGLVSLAFDDDYRDRNGNQIFHDDSASTYALQAGGGLEFAITPRFSLDLGYRYFKTGKATFDDKWDIENKLKIESHNVALGFRAKF